MTRNAPAIAWRSRGRNYRTQTARIRRLHSLDNRYAVLEIRGEYTGRYVLAAHRLDNGGEVPISRHRKAAPARRACERHARGHL